MVRVGWLVAAALAACGLAPGTRAGDGPASAANASSQQPVVLDSVIAVINGDVLLRSDLQTEMDMAALQPLSLPPGNILSSAPPGASLTAR